MDADAPLNPAQSPNIPDNRVCPKCKLVVSNSVTRCPNDGTSLLTASEVGTELTNQYEFLSVIASGGMGIIYEARHVVLNQKVAIKMIKTERLDDKNVKRFRKEAEALSALEHPNIIHVRHYGFTESGQPYMVLDYIEGMSMSQLIQSRGPIPTAFAIQFFAQVADALAHAHDRGVLHQDLKPNNIMICEPPNQTPYVKLIDFGIAKIINGEATPAGLTDTGDVLGSPSYMSPEQANGAKVDGRTDIYSLGCVIFEALTGTQPFTGASALEVIHHQIHTKAPSIQDRSITEFPRKLVEIVARCLEKKPNDRFKSMTELRDALLNVLKTDNTADLGIIVEDQNAKRSAKIPAQSTRSKVLMLSGIAIALGVIAVNVYVLISKKAAERAQKQQLITKTKQDADEAAHYDVDAVCRQMIREGIRNWHAGGELALPVENYDNELDEFGKYSPAVVSFVNLENSSVKGPGLAYLIRYPIDYLSLNESSATDRAFLEIKHMKNLKVLQVDNTSITKNGLKELKDMHLERLSVRLNKLDDEALKFISEIKSLKEVQVGRNERLTGNGYLYLKALEQLDNLDLYENKLSPKDMKAIATLTMRKLNLDDTTVDDNGIREIARAKTIHELYLSGCKNITAESLKYIATMPSIHYLVLDRDYQFGDKEVALLKACPPLTSLDLRRTSIGDKTLEWIANSRLRNLYIQRTHVTDSGFLSLLKNKSLKRVEFTGSEISPEAQAKFNAAMPGVLHQDKHDF